MNIKIKETGKIEELSIIDRNSGVNWVNDLIGNAGAVAAGTVARLLPGEKAEGKFVWSDDDDAYLADQDTYDWWAKYIADSETTDDEVESLAEKLDIGVSVIRERISENTDNDYENHRRQAIFALRDIKEEYEES